MGEEEEEGVRKLALGRRPPKEERMKGSGAGLKGEEEGSERDLCAFLRQRQTKDAKRLTRKKVLEL